MVFSNNQPIRRNKLEITVLKLPKFRCMCACLRICELKHNLNLLQLFVYQLVYQRETVTQPALSQQHLEMLASTNSYLLQAEPSSLVHTRTHTSTHAHKHIYMPLCTHTPTHTHIWQWCRTGVNVTADICVQVFYAGWR